MVQASIAMQAKVLQKLINSEDHHSSVIFTNNLQKINSEQEFFLKNLVKQNRAVVIDLNKVYQTEDDRSVEMSALHNSRLSKTYIILSNNESETFRILDKIAKISPVLSRPKTLLFFPTNSLNDELKIILMKAWFLKFLDFTVIKPEDGSNYTFMTYNPFLNDYVIKNLRYVDEIFPDKLKNVYGYPLKTVAFHAPPTISIEIKDKKIVNVSGTSFTKTQIIAKKLNFDLKFMEDPRSFKESLEITMKKLGSNEINVSPVGFRLKKSFQNRGVLVGYPTNLAKIAVVAPIVKTPRTDLTFNMLIILFIFLAILIIFYIFVRKIKHERSYWNILNIFGILIGIAVSKPDKKVNKTIYITIAILSIIFSNHYFSMLADIKVRFVDQKLNTVKDIQRLKLPIFLPDHYDLTDENTDLILQRVESADACIKILIETNDACCICRLQRAEYHLKNMLNSHNKPVMRITDLVFDYQIDAYFYEKASPFVEKFDKGSRQIFESGMDSFHDSLANKIRIIDAKQSFLSEKSLLKLIILTILCIGFALALISFVFECGNFEVCKKM